jgi:hypothetical protein
MGTRYLLSGLSFDYLACALQANLLGELSFVFRDRVLRATSFFILSHPLYKNQANGII